MTTGTAVSTTDATTVPATVPAIDLSVAEPFQGRQDYAAYTPEQHATWAELVRRRIAQVNEHACAEYLDGFRKIGLAEDRLPDLNDVSRRLAPLTGWQATAVTGFLPAKAFFAMLAARRFPTTTYIRGMDSLDYTPEPDIFHDVFGHVPLHTHPVLADFLQHYGAVCLQLNSEKDLERMARLFWFTVEFGVIREGGEVKLYGSGLISSVAESDAVIAGRPEIRNFNLDEILDQQFSISELQPVLYAIDSFEEIYEAAKQVESRLH